MSDIKQELAEARTKAKQAAEDAAKAQGALDELLARLKSDFNCSNRDEAVAELERMKKEVEDMREKEAGKLAKIREKYGV